MSEWTPGQIASAIIAIAVPVTAFLTWWASKGVDAWLKLRRGHTDIVRATREMDLLDEKQIDDGLKFLIRNQDKRIFSLEKSRDILQSQYTTCMEEHARSETRAAMQERQIENLEKMLSQYQPNKLHNPHTEDQ